jgi:hypothetical protein
MYEHNRRWRPPRYAHFGTLGLLDARPFRPE